jgi:hypothetical protein
VLCLDFNTLGDAGLAGLPAGLAASGVRTLGLRFNGVGVAGCRYLATSLLRGASLESIYLQVGGMMRMMGDDDKHEDDEHEDDEHGV